ncbi:MAG: 4Fe-4S dicluster domain-containing protein [Thermoplasmata archaeon]|nr:4Fe-4S dicluster domain-containing protein [Thermoplasmata archaeon]
MSKITKLKVENNVFITLNDFFKKILKEDAADALLIPQDLPSRSSTVQTLVRDEESVVTTNPFAFVLPTNSASLLVQTTDEKPGDRIVALFRPCELNAVLELTKLNQINLENVTLLSVDCLGTLPLPEYTELAKNTKDDDLISKLLEERNNGQNITLQDIEMRTACQICEFPAVINSDISICTIGFDPHQEILLSANTPKGEELLSKLGLELNDEEVLKDDRQAIIDALVTANNERREKLITEIKEEVKDIPGFFEVIAGCIKCHNCMNVCPICYCKECFFESSIMVPSPSQYLNKAKKRGVIRMPVDTALYHIGRMNHMITSCVSCGQCESACPSKLPLLAIYHAFGKDVQALFDYTPGRSLDEELPIATFQEDELQEICAD